MDIKPTTPSDEMPCTCSTFEAYVDGLCPGCIEAADRKADTKPKRLRDLFRTKEYLAAEAAGTLEPPEDEGSDDRYYSGTGESMDDSSYERYLNRG
jgi:hypothetical protein